MNHVIYFHGFASGPNSNKVAEISKYYKVLAPIIPYNLISLGGTIKQINDYLRDNTVPGDKVLFVGTSLGGYYAVKLADYFDAKALVINPSVDPFYDLRKFLGVNKNFQTGVEFEFTLDDLTSFMHKALDQIKIDIDIRAIICKNDPVIDSSRAISYFKDKEVLDCDDHQFKDTDKILNEINGLF